MKKYFYIIAFIYILILPKGVFGLVLDLNSDSSSYKPNTEFAVDLVIDPQGQNINGISGNISVSNASVIRVEDANSIIKNWIVRPISNNNFEFSGITPNGFSGYMNVSQASKSGMVLRLVLSSPNDGQVNILVKNVVLTKNDGEGTSLSLPDENLSIKINKQGSGLNYKYNDTTGPEIFYEVVSDSNLNNGLRTIVFNVIDNKSGSNKVFIKEPSSDYKEISSPYVLEDQLLRGIILLKAVDNAGNESVVRIYPKVSAYFNSKITSLGLGLVLFIIVLIIIYVKVKKSRHSK